MKRIYTSVLVAFGIAVGTIAIAQQKSTIPGTGASEKESKVKIYGAQGEVVVKADAGTIKVYNLAGVLVAAPVTISSDETVVAVDADGIVIVQVVDGQSVVTKKVVVKK